jgi:hypothetical protein
LKIKAEVTYQYHVIVYQGHYWTGNTHAKIRWSPNAHEARQYSRRKSADSAIRQILEHHPEIDRNQLLILSI